MSETNYLIDYGLDTVTFKVVLEPVSSSGVRYGPRILEKVTKILNEKSNGQALYEGYEVNSKNGKILYIVTLPIKNVREIKSKFKAAKFTRNIIEKAQERLTQILDEFEKFKTFFEIMEGIRYESTN